MSPLLRSVACAVSSVALLACGAPAHERQSPQSPQAYAGAPPPAPPPYAHPSPGQAQPSSTLSPAPAATTVAPPRLTPGSEKSAEEDAKASRTREQSIADFLSYEKAIFLSAPDCATACRALRSMTRAAGRACEPPAPPSSDVDCKEIGARVGRAKTRVTEVCGVCPDGPP